jgi:hypothetical protein
MVKWKVVKSLNLKNSHFNKDLLVLLRKCSGKQTGIFQTNLELPNLFENRNGVMLSFEL